MMSRVLAFGMAGIALILSLLAYANYIYMLGFPDGFITELGYAQKRLAYIFIGISLALSACFVYLGTVLPKKFLSRSLAVAIGIYSLVIIAIFLIDSYYRSSLMGSAGG
jgi:hypothetical protein